MPLTGTNYAFTLFTCVCVYPKYCVSCSLTANLVTNVSFIMCLEYVHLVQLVLASCDHKGECLEGG